MQLKDIFLSIPRSTWETLVKYHLIRESILVWYDLILFFDSLPEPGSRMGKYIETAEYFHLDSDHTRRVIRKMNRYV